MMGQITRGTVINNFGVTGQDRNRRKMEEPPEKRHPGEGKGGGQTCHYEERGDGPSDQRTQK